MSCFSFCNTGFVSYGLNRKKSEAKEKLKIAMKNIIKEQQKKEKQRKSSQKLDSTSSQVCLMRPKDKKTHKIGLVFFSVFEKLHHQIL